MKLVLTALALFSFASPLARAAGSDDGALVGSPAANKEIDGGAIVEKKPVKVKPAKTKKGATKSEAPKAEEKKPEAAPKKVTKDDGLVIEDLKVGTGMEAKEGSRVKVHYKGTFLNGKVFDQNLSEPVEKIEPFTLDAGHLIAGWVEGIPGMKVGGKRKLMVPFKLAYGENGTPDGSIPPRADLNFEVELLKVE